MCVHAGHFLHGISTWFTGKNGIVPFPFFSLLWAHSYVSFWKPGPHFSSVITKVCCWKKPKFNCINKQYIFSLCRRHQRAAVHPADRDEDEQEWTEGTRERQRDLGLTPRPFHPPDPSTFDPMSSPYIDPPSLRLLSWLLTAAQPTDRRDRPNHPGHISNAVCNPTSLFLFLLLPLPLLLPLFVPQVLWFLSLDADSRANVKKKQNNKKQGKSCIILIWNRRCGGMKQELLNIHMNNGHLRDLVNVLKRKKKTSKHFVYALSSSLCLLSLCLISNSRGEFRGSCWEARSTPRGGWGSVSVCVQRRG